MPHEIKAFQCDYCHRAFARKVDAVNHEYACRFNPKLRYCCTCKYQTKKIEEFTFTDNSPFARKTLFTQARSHCSHFDIDIHEKPYYMDCDETEDGEPIPGTCTWWEPKEEQK